jgi:alpha-L-fucosidase
VLYAIALHGPSERLIVKSLAKSSPLVQGQISDVRLLGCDDKLDWSQTEEGLVVKLPEKKPCEHAFAFKITGLKRVP